MTSLELVADLPIQTAEQRRARTEAARAEWKKRLEKQVNPDGDLPPEEVAARLKQVRSHLASEAAKRSAEVRRANSVERKNAAVQAELERLAEVAALLAAS